MDENESKSRFGAFLKNNFDGISKLFVYHIAMCLFGLIVCLAIEMVATQIDGGTHQCQNCDTFYEISEVDENFNCKVCGEKTTTKMSIATYIAGGIGALIYFGLMYVCMWEKGASDKIKIDGGRQKRNNFKGLLMWLVASAINIFLLVNIAILSFIPQAENTHGILAIIGLYYNAMYYPFLWVFSKIEITSLYLVALIPGAIVATLSYLAGVSGKKCLFPEPKGERNRKVR